MSRRVLPLLAVLSLLLTLVNRPVAAARATTTAPTTRDARLEFAEQLWEERLTKAGGKPIVAEHYPTEEALVFLTAYDFTRDGRYAKQAAVQLEYAHSRERDGLFLTSAGTT